MEPNKQGPTNQFPRTLYQSHFLLETYHMSYSMEREKTGATKKRSILKHRDGWKRHKHVEFIGQKWHVNSWESIEAIEDLIH